MLVQYLVGAIALITFRKWRDRLFTLLWAVEGKLNREAFPLL